MKLLDETPFSFGLPRAAAPPVRRFRADNGLEILVVCDRAAPIVSYQTWFRVGSRDERPGRTGIAHLFEHLMFNQTEHLAPGEFDRRLEQVGADTNAATWLDWTYYRDSVPSAHLDLVMDLEAERMAHLVVEPVPLEAERSVVINERKQRVDDDVDGFLEEELHRLAFTVHPYRWPTIGWMEDIRAITLDDARAFYRTFYAPNNATIVVVGDVDEPRMLDGIERRYGGYAPQEIAHPAFEGEPAPSVERRATFPKTVASDRAVIGWRGVGLTHPDHAVLEVIGELLFNGHSSSMFRTLVIDRELCSGLSAQTPPFRDPGLFEVRVAMQQKHRFDEALHLIDAELARLAREPVGEPLLEKSRNRLEAQRYHELRPHEGKAEALGHFHTTSGDFRHLFEGAANVRAVTSDAIRRVAGEGLLIPSRRAIVIAEPARRRRSK